MISRRSLLGIGAIGAAGAAVHPRAEQAAQLLGRIGADKSTPAGWNGVRDAFDFAHAAAPRIPMNAANLTPESAPVSEAIIRAARYLNLDASFHHRLLFLKAQRQRLATLLRLHLGIEHPSSVAVVRNTTEANAIVINGLALSAGDEIVLWAQNHDTNYLSWRYRNSSRGCRCVTVETPAQPRDDQQIIDAFLVKLTPATRVVSFSHISNVTGLRLPAAALCAAIRSYNPRIFIHVDGAQSWGAVRLDLQALDCDSYSASAHKWLAGPRELGLLYVRPEWIERLQPGTVGYDYAIEYPEHGLPSDAERFALLGQRNDAQLAGLNTALELQMNWDPDRIEARIAELGLQLRQRLAGAGFRLVTPEDRRYALGVTVVDLGVAAGEVVSVFRRLYEVHRIYGAYVHGRKVYCDDRPPDTPVEHMYLRLCPHIYNTPDDIERVASILHTELHR